MLASRFVTSASVSSDFIGAIQIILFFFWPTSTKPQAEILKLLLLLLCTELQFIWHILSRHMHNADNVA